jgi:hypothetical protein
MSDDSQPGHPRSPPLWLTAAVALAVSTAVFSVGTWLVVLPRLEAHDQRLSDLEELVAEDEPLGDESDEAPTPPSHAALPTAPGRE